MLVLSHVTLFFKLFYEFENFHNENYKQRGMYYWSIRGMTSSVNLTGVGSGDIRGRELGDSKYK